MSQPPDRMAAQMAHDLAMDEHRQRRAALQAAIATVQVSEDGEYLDPAWPDAYEPGASPNTVGYEAAVRGAADRWMRWLETGEV